MSKAVAKQTPKGIERLESLGLSEMKLAILQAAGFTPEIIGSYLKACVETFDAAMVADRVQHHVHQGHVIETTRDADHQLRVRAASEMATLMGTLGELRSSQHYGGKGDTNITLNVPFLNQLAEREKDVTPPQDPSQADVG